MLNDRRRRVLQALVEEYITSATPVGSRTLVDRYGLGCSPATVRSELSILEETGYLVQPHVSAGRVPTDTGYRSFVDDLLSEGDTELDEATRNEVRVRAAELDDLMRETSVALTRLTDCLAVVLAPSAAAATLKRISLVSMAPSRVLLVVVTDDGRVMNRHVELGEDVSTERLSDVESALNAALIGKRARDVRKIRDVVGAAFPGDHVMLNAVDDVASCLDEAARDRAHHHGGVPALLAQPEFADSMRITPLIRTIEDQLAFLEEFADTAGSRNPTVRIGHENHSADLGHVSVVAANYGTAASDGIVAVLGPTRMDYARAIAAVKAVSEALDEALR